MLFVKNGHLTDEGKQLVEYMQAQSTKNVNKFNALSGNIKHFLTMTESKTVSVEAWLEDYSNGANAAWDSLQSLQESEKQKGEADEKVSSLEEELKTLRAEMAEVKALLEEEAPPAEKSEDKKDDKPADPPATKSAKPSKAKKEPSAEDTEESDD